MLRQMVLFVLLVNVLACSPTRVIAPMEKGEQSIGAALGGPIVGGSPVAVVPLGSVAYARGLGRDFSFSAGINISALIFKSMYVDPSIHWATPKNNTQPKWPRLGLRATAHSLLGFRDGEFIVYPEFSPYLFFNNEKRNIYFGLENWIDVRAKSLSEENPKTWLCSVYSGWQWKKNKWNFQIELKYNGLNAPPNIEVLDLRALNVNGRGAIGLYFGVARKIGTGNKSDDKRH